MGGNKYIYIYSTGNNNNNNNKSNNNNNDNSADIFCAYLLPIAIILPANMLSGSRLYTRDDNSVSEKAIF